MKKFLFLFTSVLFGANTEAQIASLKNVADVTHNGDWITMKTDVQIAPDRFFPTYAAAFGLERKNSFELVRTATDALGYTHYRYQQRYAGIPVEGGEYILHAKNGEVVRANGKIIRGIQADPTATLSADAGITAAKKHVGAARYYWEMPAMEQRIKHIKKDPDATFYPTPELVLVDPSYGPRGAGYTLAWKVDLYADGPQGRKIVFVDAHTGAFVHELDGCQEGSAQGTAETRYHGTQTIITDSISPSVYRLIDATRGGGIETYDMNQGTDLSLAVDFTDDDNYWDHANAEMDNAATDAHWGMEMAYDYYQQTFGRNSFDDNGSAIISYVHVDTAWFNANFNGLWAQFGDGDGNPLTSIDVAAHELTHGVTGSSAGLAYQGESGALNESFSDIFGTAVEFFAWPSQADWLIGQADFFLRDLADPNVYDQPDTYQGTSWYNGPADNGGVHTNSGVQNFWFYLLSEGGTGTNDNADAYAVAALGLGSASAIAYRNLNYYLTSTSSYEDARQGSLAAAEDLYGPCSNEVIQAMKAWYAVGVGPDTIAHDVQILDVLTPNSSCDLGDAEPVSFSFRYNRTGCAYSMNAGDTIQVGYQLGSDTPVAESIILTNTLNEGDTITHTFQNTVDLSASGLYQIDYWVHINGDLDLQNDIINNHKVRKIVVLGANDKIGFEVTGAYLDSFFVETRDHSTAARSTAADNAGFYGFKMSGTGVTPDNVEMPLSEADVFQLNPDFGAKICMCVDATTWSNVSLSFDLQQTFSAFYLLSIGADLPMASSLRMLVNGTQVGDLFNPTTYTSDPYLTHVMDLDQFAGTHFNMCFESKAFINTGLIPGDVGDNSYLDNIFFTNIPLAGVDELAGADVKIYPVPTSGKLHIAMNAVGIQDITLIDVTGKTILQQQWNASGGLLVLDISGFASGLYTLRINSGTTNTVRQVMVE